MATALKDSSRPARRCVQLSRSARLLSVRTYKRPRGHDKASGLADFFFLLLRSGREVKRRRQALTTSSFFFFAAAARSPQGVRLGRATFAAAKQRKAGHAASSVPLANGCEGLHIHHTATTARPAAPCSYPSSWARSNS